MGIKKNSPSWSIFHQEDEFSLYSRLDDSGATFYENNCLLASLYEVLDFYRSIGFLASLPNFLVSAEPTNDLFYDSFMAQRLRDGRQRYSVAHSTLPSLYKAIREWFRDNDSYSFGPATCSKAAECVSALNSQYGLSISSRILTNFDFVSEIQNSIPSRSRMYIWNQAFGDYPAHSMPICGTYRFSKTVGWWIFSHTDYINMLRVNDNLIRSERYIDLTGYFKKYPNTGSLIEIKM